MRPSIDEINRLLAEADEPIVTAEPAGNADSILDELHAAGVCVEVRDGRLRLSPASAVDAALRGRVATHKAGILALLATVPPLPGATETWLAAVGRLAVEQEIPPDLLATLKAARVKWR